MYYWFSIPSLNYYKQEGTTLERNLVGIVKISADHRFVEQTPIYPG